jgi:hypothetical protein
MKQREVRPHAPRSPARRRLVSCVFALLAVSCGPRGSAESTTSGGTPATASSGVQDSVDDATSPESAASITTGSTGDAPASTTSTTPIDCEARNAEFGCAAIDCSNPPIAGSGCGAHHIFDLDGCMRPWCEGDDSECAPGERCYRAIDCDPSVADEDGCYPCEHANCSPDDNQCACTPLVCTTFLGVCIPAEDHPC